MSELVSDSSASATPRDVLWHLPDALTPEQLTQLRAAVLAVRGRELDGRALFVDGEPEALAREARFRPGDRLFVAGGDGSLHAAVQGVLALGEAGAPLPEIALLPRGTGNDFARALRLPLEDWETIVHVALGDRLTYPDVGYINGEPFINAVTMGFGAEATRDIPAGVKQVIGGVGYAAVTIWKAIGAEPFTLSVQAPDDAWQGEALALVVLNGVSIGGGARMGVEARIDDGYLDVAILPSLQQVGDLPELIGDWRKEDPALYEHLRYLQATSFEIETSREIALSIDGEPASGNHFSITVGRRALRFLAGDPAEDD